MTETMDDFEPEAPAAEAPVPDPQTSSEDDEGLRAEGKRALDRMKAELKAAKRELSRAQAASLTESERAVREAEERGRTTALTEVRSQLARSSFDTYAARRNPTLSDKELDGILQFVDTTKFLDDEGQINTRLLKSAVDRLVPAPAPAAPEGPPSFDGGARTTSRTQSMDDLIRSQAFGNRSV